MKKLLLTCMILTMCILSNHLYAAEPINWTLWPGKIPGGNVDLSPEYDKTKADDNKVSWRRTTCRYSLSQS